jgi:tetratricopeptide (TPR) repeat protein/DNA-binding CsgD family transcriptional regulator
MRAQTLMTNNQIDFLFDSLIDQSNSNTIQKNRFGNLIIRASKIRGYEYGEAKGKLLAGIEYYLDGVLDSAKIVLLDCSRFFDVNKPYHNSLNHGRALLYLGMVSRALTEYPQARRFANQSLEIFNERKSNRYLCASYRLLGDIESSLDNVDKALQYFLEAYRLFKTNEIPAESMTATILSIASIYSRISQFDRAITLTNSAIRIADSTGNVNVKLKALYLMGTFYKSKGNFDSALFFFGNVVKLAQLNNNAERAVMAEYNIADTYSTQGSYIQSNRLLRQMLARRDKFQGPAIRASIFHLFAKNQLKQSKYDSSIFYGRQALTLAGNRKIPQIEISDVLTQAYQGIRSYDSAIYFLRLQSTLKDSLYSQEQQRKVGSLFAEMETLEKEHEIEMLKREQELEAVKRRDLQFILISGAISSLLVIVSLVFLLRYRKRNQLLRTKELMLDIERKEQDLHNQAVKMIQINNRLSDVEAGLHTMKESNTDPTKVIQQLLGSIRMSKSMEKEWDNFNTYFSTVHKGYIERLDQRYPRLSINERRLVVLVRMNLTNKEIASILNIAHLSVKMAKYRLKRRLELHEDTDLYEFLCAFDNDQIS